MTLLTQQNKAIAHVLKHRNKYFWLAVLLIGVLILNKGTYCNGQHPSFQNNINSIK